LTRADTGLDFNSYEPFIHVIIGLSMFNQHAKVVGEKCREAGVARPIHHSNLLIHRAWWWPAGPQLVFTHQASPGFWMWWRNKSRRRIVRIYLPPR